MNRALLAWFVFAASSFAAVLTARHCYVFFWLLVQGNHTQHIPPTFLSFTYAHPILAYASPVLTLPLVYYPTFWSISARATLILGLAVLSLVALLFVLTAPMFDSFSLLNPSISHYEGALR